MTDHGTQVMDCQTQTEPATNAFRGLWRASARTAKRPALAMLLVRMRHMDVEDLCDTKFLRQLRWAWANPNSGAVEYLVALAEATAATRGSVLECGSGLSTIVVGAIAQRTGNRVVSLENSSWWSRHVRWCLKVAQAETVDYRVRPLRSFGDFDWYDLGAPVDDVTLVICDGPIATSHGGRFGLLPLCGEYLAPEARILLDDFDRPSERRVVQRWSDEFGWSVEHEYASTKGSFCSVTRRDVAQGDNVRSDGLRDLSR
jgi:Methyltransferase domain